MLKYLSAQEQIVKARETIATTTKKSDEGNKSKADDSDSDEDSDGSDDLVGPMPPSNLQSESNSTK